MAKNEIATAMRQTERIQRKLDETILRTQSRCTHHRADDMRLALIKTPDIKDVREDQRQYKCTVCYKKVNIFQFSEQQVERAIDTVDSLLDVIKIRSDLNRPKQAKLYKKIKKVQFFIVSSLKPAYMNACKNNRNNKTSRNQNGASTSWINPSYK